MVKKGDEGPLDGVDCGQEKWNEKGTVEDSGEYKNIKILL